MRNSTETQRNSQPRVYRNSLVKKVLLVAGTFFVGLGVLGIFLPVLPTTPFLLLAAACYARSSERFYHWLLNHRWFGKYIRMYREGKGVPIKVKITSISIIWLTILFSILLIVRPFIVRVILIVIAAGVTIYLLSLPTARESAEIQAEGGAGSREDKGVGSSKNPESGLSSDV